MLERWLISRRPLPHFNVVRRRGKTWPTFEQTFTAAIINVKSTLNGGRGGCWIFFLNLNVNQGVVRCAFQLVLSLIVVLSHYNANFWPRWLIIVKIIICRISLPSSDGSPCLFLFSPERFHAQHCWSSSTCPFHNKPQPPNRTRVQASAHQTADDWTVRSEPWTAFAITWTGRSSVLPIRRSVVWFHLTMPTAGLSRGSLRSGACLSQIPG